MNIFFRVFLTALAFMASTTSFAGLSRSNVSRMAVAVHGIYLSSDPLCMTGMVATVSLSAVASTLDFTSSPTLGTGSIPSTIGCVVILIKDNLGLNWRSGSYTSTTTSNSGTVGSDSVCNAGGNVEQKICRNLASVTYPQKILDDAAAAGVTLATSCPSSPTGNEIIPVYLSTYSACTGATATDSPSCAASNGGDGANVFAPPGSSGDVTKGIKITAPTAGATSYRFVADPDLVAVGNDSGACGSIGPPLFTFR